MVTMQQIADRCGVSRGTVDRALHHKEGVREEVAERIRAAARENGLYLEPPSSCSRRSSGRSAWCSTPTIRLRADAVRAVRELFRA